MDCYEAVSGARMHATYYRPGGVYRDLPEQMPKVAETRWRKGKDLERMNRWRGGSLLDFLEAFTEDFFDRVDDYETLLTDNRIWKQRYRGYRCRVGRARCADGLHRSDVARVRGGVDLRKKQPYAIVPGDGVRYSGRRQR